MRRVAPLLGALLGCAPVALRSDFPGGSLGACRALAPTVFQCAVPGQADREGRNRQVTWYHFRVDGARGRPVTVTLTDLAGEYDYRPAAPAINADTAPVLSHDGRTWRPVDAVSFDAAAGTLTLRFTPAAEQVWIAHVEPYLPQRLDGLLAEARAHPDVAVESIGTSVQGRDLWLVTVTSPAAAVQDRPVVWAMFRQHAWESGSSFAGEGMLRFLLSAAPEARRLRERVVFKIFPMLDPDGVAAGGVRFNRHGYDLNRNWDAVDLDSPEWRRRLPEVWHAKRVLHGWRAAGRPIDLFVTVHNTETAEYLTPSARAPDRAERLFRALADAGRFDPSVPLGQASDRPIPAGRMTVAHYLERALGVPALLLELRIARGPRLGRPPTSADRLALGADLARALGAAVLDD